MGTVIFQGTLIIFFPLLSIWISERLKNIPIISPIVLCFAFGILVTNLKLIQINEPVVNGFRDFSIILALPLLLFSSDLKRWISNSKTLIKAFVIAVLSGITATIVCSFLFTNNIQEIWLPAGMMVGINSGGTPNLFAVGAALEAKSDIIIITNSAQIFCGAVYLLFLISIAPMLFGKFLHRQKNNGKNEISDFLNYSKIEVTHLAQAILLSVLLIAFSVGSSLLFFNKMEATYLIVLVTSLAILSSLFSKVRDWKGTFEAGDYLLLMFGVAVGMTSDFEQLIFNGRPYLGYIVSIFALTIIIHVFLSKLFKVDRDRHIIASTAAIYGPVFIPQVTRVLKNKDLLLGGITCSMIGLALGNYLGLSISYLLRYFLT